MTHNGEKILGFIPARAESSRFPGKPLADIAGKPMIVRVLERANQCPLLDDVYVVTDSEMIARAVEEHQGKALLTDREHRSGTDRVAQGARNTGLADDDIVVNIQGDQPTFQPKMIEQVVRPLLTDPQIPMSTLIYRIIRDEEITHPNAVKTVIDREGFALYFSRSTIPYYRNADGPTDYFKHHGLYAYRNNFLQVFASLPQGVLERNEGLEQLRALENGFRIKTVLTEHDSIEVDTPEDLRRVCETLSER